MWSNPDYGRALRADTLKAHVDAGGIVVAVARPDPIASGPQARELLTWLDAQERAQHDAFHFSRDQRIYLVAHGLVRAMLAACTGAPPPTLQIRKDRWGRPTLQGSYGASDLHFSLSHTRGLVACATCRWLEIGIDVEGLDRAASEALPLAGLFTADEIRRIESSAPPARAKCFFSHWTLKEAYAKARGLGLHLPFTDFAFQQVDVRQPRIEFASPAADDSTRWNFWLEAVAPSHLLALASGERPVRGILRCAWGTRDPLQPIRFYSDD